MKQPRKNATVEQKDWMKENGYTEKQLDELWNESIETNYIIRNLAKSGMSWRDMNVSCVMQLPTQKERDAENAKREMEEKQAKLDSEVKEKANEEYYYNHFEELMVEKIENKQNLTKEELRGIHDFEIDRDDGENRRWTRSVSSILKMCGRYFNLVLKIIR